CWSPRHHQQIELTKAIVAGSVVVAIGGIVQDLAVFAEGQVAGAIGGIDLDDVDLAVAAGGDVNVRNAAAGGLAQEGGADGAGEAVPINVLGIGDGGGDALGLAGVVALAGFLAVFTVANPAAGVLAVGGNVGGADVLDAQERAARRDADAALAA